MPPPKDPAKYIEWKNKISKSLKGIPAPWNSHPLSEKHKQKLSNSRKGKRLSEEHKQKLSNAHKGKPRSEEIKKKIGISNKGKKRSDKSRIKMSESHKGRPLPEETRKKMSVSATGRKHTQDSIKKMSLENSSRWKGGISFEPYCPKFNREFKERVRAFFGNQCVECGKLHDKIKLHVHHVNFDKQTCCNTSTPLFVPLCTSCHAKTQINRIFWQYWFTEMINLHYGGKCYFSKEEYAELMRVVK
jgi:hypothetical protein